MCDESLLALFSEKLTLGDRRGMGMNDDWKPALVQLFQEDIGTCLTASDLGTFTDILGSMHINLSFSCFLLHSTFIKFDFRK